MVRATPDPIETFSVWQKGNSIQKMARTVVPAPLLTGAPYGHIDVLAALRQAVGAGGALGPQLVDNPAFVTTDAWVEGPGWNIPGGAQGATSDGTVGTLSQTISLTPGTDYLVRVESKGVYAVGLGVILGGVVPQELITVAGDEFFTITAAVGASVVGLSVANLNEYVGTVTRVMVWEVL